MTTHHCLVHSILVIDITLDEWCTETCVVCYYNTAIAIIADNTL